MRPLESGIVNGGATAAAALAKPTTSIGAIFGATPGMPGMFKSNFDYQLVRGMRAGAYGEGGAFGELYSTARQVVDRDVESWTVKWSGTAERVEAIGHNCLSGGHVVSAAASIQCLRTNSARRDFAGSINLLVT